MSLDVTNFSFSYGKSPLCSMSASLSARDS